MVRKEATILKPQNTKVGRKTSQRKGGVIRVVDYGSLHAHPPVPDKIVSIYNRETLRQLSEDFPLFRKQDLQLLINQKQGFYAPSFILCYDCLARNAPVPLRYRMYVRVNFTERRIPKYGDKRIVTCQEFEAERIWVQDWKGALNVCLICETTCSSSRPYPPVAHKRKRASDVNELHAMRQELAREWAAAQHHAVPQPPAVEVPQVPLVFDPDEDVDTAESIPDASVRIECGCCSDDSTPFISMMQCPDGHLFCKDCVRMQADTVIGNRKTDILCMDQSDCKLPFTIDILSGCLDERTIALWEKLKQAKDIRDANLEGLEDCPFCDYAIINPFTPEQLPLFHCAKCEKVSCRRCKKQDHTGRPCHDPIDARLKAEHAIAEAMTEAILRVCPKCKTPFIKDQGCNKMRCHACNVYVCYVCRRQILDPRPYSHFNGQGANVPGKCPLYDGNDLGDPTRRHEAEVAAAEKAARGRLRMG